MYRIIAISDNETFLKNAQTFLPKYIDGVRVIPLTDPEMIEDVLREDDADAYIVDDDPPVIDSVSIFNRRNARQDYRPFMITAESVNEDTLLRSFEIGVSAYFPRKSAPAVDFLGIAKKMVMLIEKHRIEQDNKVSDRRLKALLELSRMYNHSVDDIMHYSLDESRKLTESEMGYLALYDAQKDELEVRAWSQKDKPADYMPDIPLRYRLSETGVWGMPVRLRKGTTVNSCDPDDPDMDRMHVNGHAPLNRFMVIPLMFKGEVIGTACMANKKRDYTEADRDQFTLMMDGFVNVYAEKMRMGRGSSAAIKLKRIMEAFPFAALIIDNRLKIQEYNQAADELLGIGGSETMNMGMSPLSVNLMYEFTKFTMDGKSSRMHTDIPDPSDGNRMYCVEMTSAVNPEGGTEYLITIREQDLEVLHGLNHECCDFYGMMDSAVTEVEKKYTDMLAETDILLPDSLRLAFESMIDLARIYGIHPNMNADDNQWQDVEEMIDRAVTCSGIGCRIENNAGNVFLKASPMYYRAFVTASHMLLRRGASELSINYRIFHGTLTLHMDCGAPYNLITMDTDGRSLSPVDSACLHFIEHISQISGFSFRKEWLTSSNMRLSIDVPAELYEIH